MKSDLATLPPRFLRTKEAAEFLSALTDSTAARAHAKTTELLAELGTFVVEMRNALTRPTHPYGNEQFTTFVSDRIDFDKAYHHLLFNQDWSALALK